jgi:hypothetical protein
LLFGKNKNKKNRKNNKKKMNYKIILFCLLSSGLLVSKDKGKLRPVINWTKKAPDHEISRFIEEEREIIAYFTAVMSEREIIKRHVDAQIKAARAANKKLDEEEALAAVGSLEASRAAAHRAFQRDKDFFTAIELARSTGSELKYNVGAAAAAYSVPTMPK